MSGSNNFKYYEESSVVSFNTNYATGDLYAAGLEIDVNSTGSRSLVGLEGNLLSNVYTLTNKMTGKDPIFGVATYSAVSAMASASLVHTGGTVPSVNPTPLMLATGQPLVFGTGGSGVGTDSTFYWQYTASDRYSFGVQSLLNYEPSLSGTWKIEIVRTSNSVLSVPFQFSANYNKFGYDYFSPTSFCFIDQPGNGSHNYKIRLSSSVTSGQIALVGVKLIFREI